MRMTKMINGMGEDEYNLRLSKTKLLSPEMRRLTRSDLKGHCIEFKYYADGIHSGLTPPA